MASSANGAETFAGREQDALPPRHPCLACEVRGRALCAVLDSENLSELKRLGPSLKLTAGHTLFREGDPINRVFTLTRGSIKLYKLMPDGRRQIVAFMYAGDFLGISTDQEHAFTAELLEDAELCSFSRARFANFLTEHPAMEHDLYRLAAQELGAAQLQFIVLGRKSATERLASFLLLVAEQAERRGSGNSITVHLPMSRADIADYLALTKETVSRVFSEFRADRMIRLTTLHDVEILDRAALRRLAG